MQREHWTIEGLPWERFDAGKIDPEILKIVKAAALVEYNAHDYASYLRNVFANDPEFGETADQWAREEVQHGAALGRWAERADPSFDFQKAVARYRAGYRVNVDARESLRGSPAGELVARCIVETGTSSYYSALGDAVEEPVLKAICRNVAADEYRHYAMFYNRLTDYLHREGLSRLDRLKISLGRIMETEDDELAYAFYAANAAPEAPFVRAACSEAYAVRAYSHYRRQHVVRVVAMVFKACGLPPNPLWQGVATKAAWWLMRQKAKPRRIAACRPGCDNRTTGRAA